MSIYYLFDILCTLHIYKKLTENEYTRLSHLCRPVRSTFAVRETQSLGQQMLNAPVGINGLTENEYTRLYTVHTNAHTHTHTIAHIKALHNTHSIHTT